MKFGQRPRDRSDCSTASVATAALYRLPQLRQPRLPASSIWVSCSFQSEHVVEGPSGWWKAATSPSFIWLIRSTESTMEEAGESRVRLLLWASTLSGWERVWERIAWQGSKRDTEFRLWELSLSTYAARTNAFAAVDHSLLTRRARYEERSRSSGFPLASTTTTKRYAKSTADPATYTFAKYIQEQKGQWWSVTITRIACCWLGTPISWRLVAVLVTSSGLVGRVEGKSVQSQSSYCYCIYKLVAAVLMLGRGEETVTENEVMNIQWSKNTGIEVIWD